MTPPLAMFATGLQFLRPAWLPALLLLPVLAWAWRRQQRRRSAWRAAVDPHLLPHLLAERSGHGAASFAGASALAGLALAILAMAGPSWRGIPQPLQGGGGALAIVLDLSSATLANDLQPTRLAQARARIDALLQAHAGEVALVAYADDAFVVSPVTPDPDNVAVFLDALAPDVMPVDGARPGAGIDLARELLARAGHARGDILLLAPGADPAALRAAAHAATQGYRVSVLAMGTVSGAGYRGRDGAIHRSALDPASLQALATAGGGRVHGWETPPRELLAAMGGGGAGTDTAGAGTAGARDGNLDASGRQLVAEDGGFWLLPPAMFLLLAAFRRGGVLVVLCACLVLPMRPVLAAGAGAGPATAAAQAPAPALEASAWRRADQSAHVRSRDAEAAYREGDFARAARGFAGLPGADAAYNRGNALARTGRYEEAIAAYDDALRQQPDMPDALANRAAVEAVMRRQPPPSGGGRGGDSAPDAGQGGRGEGAAQGDRGDDGQDAPDQDAGRERDGSETGPQPREPEAAGSDAPEAAEEDPAEAQARQQAADAAQREAIQRALDAGAAQEQGAGANGAPEGALVGQDTAEQEREQANEAWLRRVPDDPGALLRARFRNEHLLRRAGER